MPQIAFLFPGQGAQSVGMGLQAAGRLPAAKKLYDAAAEVLGYDLADISWNGPAERLNSTVISQPAIFVASVAALETLKAENPDSVAHCSATAGLSLGEYTALAFAGALSFEDGLRVVQQRGKAMQAASDATPSGMVSLLMLDRDQVEAICAQAATQGVVHIANYLCRGNIAVSGARAACQLAAELAEQAGGKAVRLSVAGAFHTEIMKPADARLSEALAGVAVRKPVIPVYSNVDGRPHVDPDEIRQILVRQVLSPVLWEDAVRNMLADGADRFYEVGPGKVLRGLLKRIDRKADCQSVNDS